MLDLLGIRSGSSYPLTVRYLDYIKNTALNDLNKIIEKNNRYPYFVPSNHLLAQYIAELDIGIDSDDFTFYSDMKSKVLHLASNFGITTNINTGVIHNGAMYGVDKDIIIGYSGIHNPSELSRKWEYLSPITVLRHGYKNYDLQPIVKQDKVSTRKTNVFLIDLMSLAFQYRGYLKRAIKNKEDTGLDLHNSVSKYLSRYPLNNLLVSHLQMCILNNIYSKVITDYTDRSRFINNAIMDYNSQLEYIRDDTYNQLKSKEWDIGRVITSISLIGNTNLADRVDMSGIDINRQNSWAYLYSFIPHLIYSLSVGNKSINSNNISNIKRVLDMYRNDGVWNIQTVRYIKNDVLNEIDTLYSLM